MPRKNGPPQESIDRSPPNVAKSVSIQIAVGPGTDPLPENLILLAAKALCPSLPPDLVISLARRFEVSYGELTDGGYKAEINLWCEL